MSLESFIEREATFFKEQLKEYHQVFDYLIGFLTEEQWLQALETALTDNTISFSIMEDVLDTYKDDWSIDINMDELVLKACVNVRKLDKAEDKNPDFTDYETIIKNVQRRIDKQNEIHEKISKMADKIE